VSDRCSIGFVPRESEGGLGDDPVVWMDDEMGEIGW
jgi:hypothetical protein